MKGVEYYSKDKHVGYVKNQVTGIIKEAIRKFDERNAAMAIALTGIDQIPEKVEERSEKQTGSRPIKPDIGIVSHNNPNDLTLTQNEFGVQEKPVKSLGRGEYSTLTTESMTAETDGNTFLTDNTSLYTQGYKQFYDATALTNRKTKSSKTRKTFEGETLRLLKEARNVSIDDCTGFSLATSHNDVLLEIDNESLNKNTVRNATLKAAKAQGTLSKGFDTTDIDNDACLFADKFPNDFSRTSQNVKHSSQGAHSRLRSTIDSYESVLGLCMNSTKRFGSLDNGYHINFSHIYKTSQTRRPGTEQDDDEVD
uniref:Uncharacterized protein n=1 Tax=Magallana gigas TaxID=29159 RepID=K1PMZ8_MAGGI